MANKQKDAKKTGFPTNLVKAFKGNFAKFKKWYDPIYKNLTAEEVWKSKGGEIKK